MGLGDRARIGAGPARKDDPNRFEKAAAEFLADKPTIQDVLMTLGQPGSAVSNALQGDFEKAGRNVLQFLGKTADAVLPGDMIPDAATPQDMSSFKDVLTHYGVEGDLGEVDLPFIGRVTGKGALGFTGDVATDPLRFGRFGRLTEAGEAAAKKGGLSREVLGMEKSAAREAGQPITALGRQSAANERALFGARVPFTSKIATAKLPGETALFEHIGRGSSALGRTMPWFSTTRGIPSFGQAQEAGLVEGAKTINPIAEKFGALVPKLEDAAKDAGLTPRELFSEISLIAEKPADLAAGPLRNLSADKIRSIRSEAIRIGRELNEHTGTRFSKSELGEVMDYLVKHDLHLDPLGYQKAIGATRLNRVYDEILNAEEMLGLTTKQLDDPRLNYIYRMTTPEARKFMDARFLQENVFSQLDGFSTKGRPQRARSMTGIDTDAANQWFRKRFNVDYDLFETDARIALAGRLRKTMGAANMSGMIEHLAQTFGRLADDAALEAGYAPLKPMLDSLGFTHTGVPGQLADYSRLALPPELIAPLRHYAKTLRSVETPGQVMRAYDAMTTAFKTFVTSIFPAFHSRNFVSNLWANYLGDVSMSAYTPAARAMGQWLKIRQTADSGSMMTKFGVPTDSPVAQMTLREFIDELKARRSFGHGQFSLEELEGPGVVEAVGSNVGSRVTRAPGVKHGRALGDHIESYAKIAHVLDKLRKGFTLDEAVASSKKHLFDYGDLTSFEKTVMRRVIPFYTWSRKNVPLMIETLITKPGKASMAGHAQRALQRPIGNEEPVNQTIVPPWVREGLFGTRRNKDGSVAIMSGLGIGLEDLSRWDQPFGTLLGFLKDIHPIPKAIVQDATNRDLFTGRELSRMDSVAPMWGALEHVPGGKAFLNWMGFRRIKDREGNEVFARADPRKMNWISAFTAPTARVGSTLRQVGSAMREERGGELATSLLTGFKSKTFDSEQQIRANLRGLLNARQEFLRGVMEKTGETQELRNTFFVRDYVGDPGSREKQRAEEALREIREIRKALKELD